MWGYEQRELLLGATLVRGVPAGAAIAALRAAPEAAADPPGLEAGARAAWRRAVADGALRRALEAELEALARLGADFVTPACPDWPPELPPDGVLRVRGRLEAAPRLAIVGARRADGYGRELGGRIAVEAVRAGAVVVSGGAFGIDAAAHRGALDAGGATVVVLGSGLAHPSPAAHRRLFERAAECGAVVSPFPTAQPPDRWTFPRRNRWIAGLAFGVVVVQAGARSGALHTAAAATALGRPVWAAPGPLDSPLHRGCHALIREGAALLARDDQWREALPGAGAATSDEAGETGVAGVASHSGLSQHRGPDIGAALWNAAGVEPTSLSRLAERAGLSVEEAAPLATRLELEGWLRACPGGRYARATPRTWTKTSE